MSRLRRIPPQAWAGLTFVGLVVVALAVAIALDPQEVARGQLLPFKPGETVVLMEVAGYDIYVSERFDIASEILNGLALAVICGGALMAAVLLWTVAGASRRVAVFAAIVFLGAGLLALDEILELSEMIEHNLQEDVAVLRPGSLLGEVDTAIYGLVALGVAVAFRRELLAARPALPWLAAGAGLAALALAGDATDRFVSESLEVVATGALAIGSVLLWADHLRRPLELERRP